MTRAISAIADLGKDAVKFDSHLERLLNDPDPDVRDRAEKNLYAIKRRRAREGGRRALTDMSETFKIVVGSAVIVLYALHFLSQKFPHVTWLRHFRIPWLRNEGQGRRARWAAVSAGAQLILLGVILPIGYVVLTVMTFSNLTTRGMTLALAGSVLCIVLGIAAVVQGGRSR